MQMVIFDQNILDINQEHVQITLLTLSYYFFGGKVPNWEKRLYITLLTRNFNSCFQFVCFGSSWHRYDGHFILFSKSKIRGPAAFTYFQYLFLLF